MSICAVYISFLDYISSQTFLSDFFCDVAWINDGSFAASWPGHRIHIFTGSSTVPFRTFSGHSDEINQIRVTVDRKLLASVSDDGTARIWSLDPLKMIWVEGSLVPAENSVGGAKGQSCLHLLAGHTGMVHACRWLQPDPDKLSDRILATYVFKKTTSFGTVSSEK